LGWQLSLHPAPLQDGDKSERSPTCEDLVGNCPSRHMNMLHPYSVCTSPNDSHWP
jgi:hypothetical protein